MRLHRNAKLGPAGRRELVRAIERGATMRQAAACSTSRQPLRTAGGIAGTPPTLRRASERLPGRPLESPSA